MNTFIKVGATALLMLVLTACSNVDKGNANGEVSKVEISVTEGKTASGAVEFHQGAEDFKKLVAWNSDQEKEMAAEQSELQQMIATQDQAKIEEAFRKFALKVGNVIRSLEAVEIKNAEVQKLKDKLKESLSLSSEVLSGSLSAMRSGEANAELQAELQAKSQRLIEIGKELETLQSELRQKFIK